MAEQFDPTRVYSRTAKAIRDLSKPDSHLGPTARRLLTLIDGAANLGEIGEKLGQVDPAKLQLAITNLVELGYLHDTRPPDADLPSLDFTKYLVSPARAPSAKQQAQAEQLTIAGMRTLKKAGFYVNILSKPGKPLPPHDGKKHCVIIIDNDEGTVLVLARELLLSGFNVRSASKQDEIVLELNKPPLPDVVIMDTELQGLNGLNVLAKLRQHPLYKTVPIIVVTSHHDQENVVASLARGANGYMTKPLRGSALVDGVQAVLGLK